MIILLIIILIWNLTVRQYDHLIFCYERIKIHLIIKNLNYIY